MDTNDKMNTGNVASDGTMNSLDHERRLTLLESYTGRLVGIVEALTRVVVSVEEIDDGLTDAEADSDTLASAGYGTDEDYGGTDERL